MRKITSRVSARTHSILKSFLLFAFVFLLAGIGQTAAQSDFLSASSPYGGKTFVEAPEAMQLLGDELPGLYSELNNLQDGTLEHKWKTLEVLCYKKTLSDISQGVSVPVAYEENLSTFAKSINPAETGAVNFIRDVHAALFELLTN